MREIVAKCNTALVQQSPAHKGRDYQLLLPVGALRHSRIAI